MKPASECIKSVEAAAKKAAASFDRPAYKTIDTLLKKYVFEPDLVELNNILAKQQRRQLTVDDVVRVAFVHALSIHENNGHSPYRRLAIYCKHNGHEYNNQHLKLITDLLLQMGFMILKTLEDRRSKKCRSYELAPEVKEALSAPAPNSRTQVLSTEH